MFKLLRVILVVVGVLVLLLSGIMVTARHDQIAPSWIAYLSHDGLYLMDADGAEQRLLTKGRGSVDSFPQWSPDGQWIVSTFWIGNELALYRIRPNGRDQQWLVQESTSYFYYPRWSPDGQWILFSYHDGSTVDFYRMHPDGNDLQQLTTGYIGAGYANWSPDGNWVAFITNHNLYRMRSDGTSLQMLISSNDMVNEFPEWTSDGQWIMFGTYHNEEYVSYRILIDGTGQQQIGNGSFPQWSPDRQWIVFVNDGIIYKMRPDGTEQQALTPSTQVSDMPQWLSNGQWILFCAYGRGIYRIRPDATDEQLLAEISPSDNPYPALSPPIRSDWHPWRSIMAGIGLIGLAICPWRKLMRRISHDQVYTRDSSVVRSAGAAPERDHSGSAV
jgi:Tol biopolymer transport system component